MHADLATRRGGATPGVSDLARHRHVQCAAKLDARLPACARRIEVTTMFRTIDAISEGARYDIIVIGSGAAGMAAALFAAIEGRKVLVVERTEYVGGTSALSAATTW